MTIKYWTNFNKRVNSTAVPSDSGAITLTNVNIKQPTSIESPTFIISGDIFEINYISAFGHYYFVTDVYSVNKGLVEVSCSQDVLATYKSYITSSSQLVSRCVTNPDYTLIDEKAISTMTPQVVTPVTSSGLPLSISNGTVVITCKSGNGSTFYGMKFGIFEELARTLYAKTQSDIWNDLNVGLTFTQTFLDPMGFVTDVKLIPIDYSNVSGTTTDTINLGYWSYTDPDGTQVFKEISGRVLWSTSDPITITLQALQTDENQFLNSNKFRQVTANFPGAGNVEIDADLLTQGNELNIDAAIDVSGSIAYRISYGTGHVVYTSGSIGIPVAMHSNVMNLAGILSGAGSVVGSISGGAVAGSSLGPWGAVGGAILGGVSAIPSAIANAQPLGRTQTRGSDGSLAGIAINSKIVVNETRYRISGRAPLTNGYPCMKYLQLSTLSGYCQCINASVPMPGFEEDKHAVESYLNSGFYIE